MNRLQIILPMAGLGSRFKAMGVNTPKPLIEVDGVPMYIKAISSLENIQIKKEYIFVIRNELDQKHNLSKLIQQRLPDSKVVILPALTRGAAESALRAKDLVNPEAKLLIMDCDLWFKSTNFENLINNIHQEEIHDGALLYFSSNKPRYSYLKLSNGLVSETAEKVVISEEAIIGAYFFSKAKYFMEAAQKLINQPLNKNISEYYISLVYNILINDGKRIKAAKAENYHSFGTPEELDEYNNKICKN